MIVALVLAAMVPATAPGSAERVASAFWAHDLGAARFQLEQLIVHRPDPKSTMAGPEHFWRELFELADCVPLTAGQDRPHVPQNEWEVLIALVRLERMRQRRFHGVSSPPGLHTDLLKRAFFRRAVETPDSDNVIAWPRESELWGDERLSVKPRESECTATAATSPTEVDEWRAQELAAIRAIESVTTPEEGAMLRFEEAALLFQQGSLDAAFAAARPLYEAPPSSLTPAEAAQAALFKAMDLERQGDQAGALAIYARLADTPVLARQQDYIRSRREWALAAANRYDALLAVLPEEPDLTTALGRYEAYLRARALLGLHRYDGLLDLARKTFRRAPGEVLQSPEIGYLNDEVYEYLATITFDSRVVEIVESLGPPRLIYPRIERLADIAAKDLQLDAAKSALNWLLEHHHSAEHHPRYRAKLTEIAFESGDLDGFVSLLHELATPSEQLLKAIPPSRRGQFFAERDQQLLEVVAHVVPRLAERNDDRWTQPVVSTVQEFLLAAPETKFVRPLTELYRTAKTLLGTGAQAYSERVGDRKPPIVLGEIEVPHPKLELAPPTVPVEIAEPSSLLRIPVGADPKVVRSWFDEATP